MKIGNNIRSLRQNQKRTIEEVAQRSGITKNDYPVVHPKEMNIFEFTEQFPNEECIVNTTNSRGRYHFLLLGGIIYM
ncbi:unnamed protein product [marine sediment metagenome]|uniref:Uncharacterized protein n=1 Tax=marine sediment metagenome TaxID=412755 RepID=X1HFD7_9ZZZZ